MPNPSDENNVPVLHLACATGVCGTVETLLLNGADVDLPTRTSVKIGKKKAFFPAGSTPLHVALVYGHLEIAKCLLERGADVNAGAEVLAREAGKTRSFFEAMLTHARKIGKTSPLVDLLPTHARNQFLDLLATHIRGNEHAQTRLRDDTGLTPLHFLAFQMDFRAIEQLIRGGADVNAKARSDSPLWSGCTALHAWAQGVAGRDCGEEGVQRTLELLLGGGADVTLANAALDTPLHLFAGSKKRIDDEFALSTGRSLLRSQRDFGVNPTNSAGLSHFHVAVRFCDVGAVDEFLERGVDVNAPIGDPFHEYKIHYFPESGHSCLHLLIYCRYCHSDYFCELPARFDTFDLLLKRGADVSARDTLGNTLLHDAATAEIERVKLIEMIIQAGGSVDAVNDSGDTPLANMLKHDNFSAQKVDLFLRHGARVNAYNLDDQMGLLSEAFEWFPSSKERTIDVLEVLFNSPDIVSVDEAGRTAIHNVGSSWCDGPHYKPDAKFLGELVERLVELGCDIDARDRKGRTALHTAARRKNDAAVCALLANGADVNLVDGDGKLAFEYGLEPCHRCKEWRTWKDDDDCYHEDLIGTIIEHVQKMRYAGLELTTRNGDLIEKALEVCAASESTSERFQVQLEKTREVFVADSLRLFDFVSETGAVAAYPTMSLAKRQAVDEFFARRNEKLKDLDELRNLLMLQYKKLVKRAALFERAESSLSSLSGIPLPRLCTEVLLRYLGFSDVESLVVLQSQ